jgi:bifunctional non-homologous end joining protein LigD
MAGVIEPMLALRVPDLPAGDWIYEVKFDGYRALAFKTGSALLAQPQAFQ